MTIESGSHVEPIIEILNYIELRYPPWERRRTPGTGIIVFSRIVYNPFYVCARRIELGAPDNGVRHARYPHHEGDIMNSHHICAA